ncbi:MAG: UDP-N-acetylglucosamine 2-epimerase [Chloroflexi bacterium]|nr:UDP-N-acetylglucosamine 2-epimerase [Chloroflexota bacterium]
MVTTSRADYGIFLPVLRQIQADPALHLHLLVTGTHLSPQFGLTSQVIQDDGFEIAEKIEMLVSSDTPEGMVKSMGLGLIGLSQAYSRKRPDILLVLGDRFEMHGAALAALPFKIPVAHIHGGELTAGAIDDSLRHSITKLSHLHFVSTDEYRQRVIQLGEEPWRVITSGAPGLDNLHNLRLLSRTEIESFYHLKLAEQFLLVTYHPVTLEFEQTQEQVEQLLHSLRQVGLPIVFTGTNADTGGRIIRSLISQFVDAYPQAQMIENLGTQGYFSLMNQAIAMVGNSSSGIIEAPSIGLPVVNIGTRQQGRIRSKNVIDVGYGSDEIVAGIKQAIAPEFRAGIAGVPNLYGNGQASEIIVRHLKKVSLDHRLISKQFVDAPHPSAQLV